MFIYIIFNLLFSASTALSIPFPSSVLLSSLSLKLRPTAFLFALVRPLHFFRIGIHSMKFLGYSVLIHLFHISIQL